MQTQMLIPLAAMVGLAGVRAFTRRERIIRKIEQAYSWADAELAAAIFATAQAVEADPYALANLIHFESRGNPRARNSVTGATGLIQFIPSTARSLGTSTQAIASMSALQQLELAEAYLKRTAKGRSLRAPYRLAMAVFYPKAMRWPSFQPFPLQVVRANGWKIFTPGDYLDRMSAGSKLPRAAGLLA